MTAAAWVLRLYGVGYIGIRQLLAPACCALALALAPLSVRADTVLDWNAVVLDVVRLMRLTPPMASRELAIVNTAAFDAVDAASGLPFRLPGSAPPAAGHRDIAGANLACSRPVIQTSKWPYSVSFSGPHP